MNTCHTLPTDHLIMISLWSGKLIYPPIISAYECVRVTSMEVLYDEGGIYITLLYVFVRNHVTDTKDKYITRGSEKKNWGHQCKLRLNIIKYGRERERKKSLIFYQIRTNYLRQESTATTIVNIFLAGNFPAYQIVACFAYSISDIYSVKDTYAFI